MQDKVRRLSLLPRPRARSSAMLLLPVTIPIFVPGLPARTPCPHQLVHFQDSVLKLRNLIFFVTQHKQNRSTTCRGRLHPCLSSLGSRPVLEAIECANQLLAYFLDCTEVQPVRNVASISDAAWMQLPPLYPKLARPAGRSIAPPSLGSVKLCAFGDRRLDVIIAML